MYSNKHEMIDIFKSRQECSRILNLIPSRIKESIRNNRKRGNEGYYFKSLIFEEYEYFKHNFEFKKYELSDFYYILGVSNTSVHFKITDLKNFCKEYNLNYNQANQYCDKFKTKEGWSFYKYENIDDINNLKDLPCKKFYR